MKHQNPYPKENLVGRGHQLHGQRIKANPIAYFYV